LKYGLTPNLTLDATINPDFGQVEADPAVLNLSVFETFFQERRPFFVQGAGIFRFDVNCSAVNDCSTGEGLFYSRRIGRSPQLADYGDAGSSVATTIYGAAKLTGRLPGGQTIGVLDAVTGREAGTLDPSTATSRSATRCTTTSGPVPASPTTRPGRRSGATPKSSNSGRWGVESPDSRPATSAAPRGSR